jgi:hypothetical protein
MDEKKKKGNTFQLGHRHYLFDFTKPRLRMNEYVWRRAELIFAIMSIDEELAVTAYSSKYEQCKLTLQKLLNEKKYDNVEIVQDVYGDA